MSRAMTTGTACARRCSVQRDSPDRSLSAAVNRGSTSTGTAASLSSTRFTSGRTTPIFFSHSRARSMSPDACNDMISPVSLATASRILSGTTANVPSAATRTAPASRSVFSYSAIPLPCATLVPKRMERNAEARKVTYMVRSSDRSSTPLSTSSWSANKPEMSAFASSKRAAGLLHGLAHRRSLPSLVRPQPVHQLVHEDLREESLERDLPAIGPAQGDLRDGQERLAELGLLNVLQHHPLGPALPGDPLVIGQVVGGRLHAMVAVAAAEDLVDHLDGSEGAQLRIAQLRVDGERVFDALELGGETRELRGLPVVDQRDEGLERGLLVEPVVGVDLVGPDGGLDRRVQLHPRYVALVVVVGKEGLRARRQEPLERRLLGELRGLAQQLGRAPELVLVLDAVRHPAEPAVRSPPDGGVKARRQLAVVRGERLLPSLDLFLGRARRVEVGLARPR